MRGDVETIKERLDIAEIVGGYVKLEKAGQSFKARCPFHNEKTPSFFVSPVRQSYYCFGCGAKGDIFTFVQELDGLSFKEALKTLADRAGVEIKYRPEAAALRTEKDKIRAALETATEFFENQLEENSAAKTYLKSRGISEDSVTRWRLGYAPAEWRALYAHLLQLGFSKEILLKAGLAKPVDERNDAPHRSSIKEPYDVFRDRIIFPISDVGGEIIAFSGRALAKETEPKYLNSPDTVLWTKSETLYGLDKAKEKIRRKDYAILVEGQMDLLLSHQVGIDNAVASSGTAFTAAHLARLKRLSKRIILAFDGDSAGEVASEKASSLALALGLEVKVAKLPTGRDPADVAHKSPEDWKEILRHSKQAIEHFLDQMIQEEKDSRKLGKLIEKKILPLVAFLESSMERSHFISLISKCTGIKEDIVWEDLKRAKTADVARKNALSFSAENARSTPADTVRDVLSSQHQQSRKDMIEERLTEVRLWLKELPENSEEFKLNKKEEAELENHLAQGTSHEELTNLTVALSLAETSKDQRGADELALQVQAVLKKIAAIEEKKKSL